MSLHTLFPPLRVFRLLSSHREAKRVVLSCERVTPTARCPVCGTPAYRIHSRYQRTVWDLSVQNVQVVLHLHVRKFYCDQPSCPRRITASRLPQVTSSHGRFTFGLREFLAQLGREHGGAAGTSCARPAGCAGGIGATIGKGDGRSSGSWSSQGTRADTHAMQEVECFCQHSSLLLGLD